MNKYEDKIEYLIANEARQKRVAVISVLLFTLAAIAIIILSVSMANLRQKNRVLTGDKEQLQQENKLKDSIIGLQTVLLRRFQDSISQSRLIALQDEGGPEPGAMPPEPSAIPSQPPMAMPETGTAPVRTAPDVRNRPGAMRPPGGSAGNGDRYTVYIQYAGGSKASLQQLQSVLGAEAAYKIPQAELIAGQRFVSSVRYFDRRDEAAARRLATLAGESCGREFAVQWVPLKAPARQLEVWIGEQ